MHQTQRGASFEGVNLKPRYDAGCLCSPKTTGLRRTLWVAARALTPVAGRSLKVENRESNNAFKEIELSLICCEAVDLAGVL